MLQSVMISEYRRIIAKQKLNRVIKPTILFKTVKNTANIDALFEKFIKQIENLSIKDLDEIYSLSSIDAIKKLKNSIDKQDLVNAIKYGFKKDSCLVIHSKVKDKEEKLKYLNTLENPKNPIRAIFAVDILNEGWDVLNLFDIIKLDEAKKTASSTISEAQLIGRGARYFPFEYKDYDKYKRKFDKSPDEEAKILEQMYFHSINQSDYIKAITEELKRIGLINEDEQNEKTIALELKQEFVNSDLYKYGYIYTNKQIPQDKSNINSIGEYVNSYKKKKFYIDNQSKELKVYTEDEMPDVGFKFSSKFKISKIEPAIVRTAINKRSFFYFSSLKKYFQNLKSTKEFIESESYLGGIEIILNTTKKLELTHDVYIKYILEVLEELQRKIEKNNTTKVGSYKFYPNRINTKIPIKKHMKQKNAEFRISRSEDWYVFKAHECTSEEQYFIEFIKENMKELKARYDDIKVIRNEKAFDIFSFDKKQDGARFEPDFIILLKDKQKNMYQVFCEPKGNWTKDDNNSFGNSSEKWKNDFLEDITKATKENKVSLENINEKGLSLYENSCYKILGLPFYNYDMENEFEIKFKDTILK